jgi:hypothetical protein
MTRTRTGTWITGKTHGRSLTARPRLGAALVAAGLAVPSDVVSFP